MSLIDSPISQVTAFAPASVGNVAVGFDLLGHALCGPGDRVLLRKSAQAGITIRRIHGCVEALPREPKSNTASCAVQALCDALGIKPSIEIEIEKGIPLSSGLGGSAASAVAAVVAANRLLGANLGPQQLYPFALAGEAVASGAAHGDNVGAQLLGGLVLATPDRLVSIPVPDGLTAVVVHPDYRVATRDARKVLTAPFLLETVVRQSTNLAMVLSGCFQSRLELIAEGLVDVMVEPRRASLIPGFDGVRQAALDHGALGASISGAGPSVFGWFRDSTGAADAGAAMVAAFARARLSAQAYLSPVQSAGARVEESR
ncbi:MAG: homoserine kinase [Xanthomonadaceae bacterium]|nr:homoserine kinase [Xanthomonadaceae bacterium]